MKVLHKLTAFDNAWFWMGVPAVCGVAVVVLMFSAVSYEESTLYPQAYQAWVKLTGNEQQLTYEEWKSLLDSGYFKAQ